MLSNKRLKAIEVTSEGHTSEDDIISYANNDFVFFAPYLASEDYNIEDFTSRSIYGHNNYFFDIEKSKQGIFGYFTFGDHTYPTSSMGPITWEALTTSKRICKDIQPYILSGENIEKWLLRDGHRSYIFTANDMRAAIAYQIISCTRFLEEIDMHTVGEDCIKSINNFLEFTYNAKTPEDFNVIFKTMCPTAEFHVPAEIEISINNKMAYERGKYISESKLLRFLIGIQSLLLRLLIRIQSLIYF